MVEFYLGLKSGRGREIRTPDILLPKQARYQTALYPDIIAKLGLEKVSNQAFSRLATAYGRNVI